MPCLLLILLLLREDGCSGFAGCHIVTTTVLSWLVFDCLSLIPLALQFLPLLLVVCSFECYTWLRWGWCLRLGIYSVEHCSLHSRGIGAAKIVLVLLCGVVVLLRLVLTDLFLCGGGMVLLLLGILHRATAATKLESNSLWYLDLWIDCREVGSLCHPLVWWQLWHCRLESWVSLIHLKWWHRNIMLVLLTDVQSLLQDFFVAYNADVGIVCLSSWVIVCCQRWLIYGHLLNYIGE